VSVASPAEAATVAVRVDPGNTNFAGIVYRVDAGEANRLTLTYTEEFRTIRVVDAGAVIVAGSGCRSTDPNNAECTIADMPGVLQLLGADVLVADRDDTVESIGPGLVVDGGPGDDSLRGTSGVAGTLNGGGGRDMLVGGSNSDMLIDGDSTGAADTDILDGRGDADTVNYATRTARVRVDLADPASDGEVGENDVLRSVERVRGGSAGDWIGGTSGFNSLDGLGGDDRIFGRAGTDFISGGAGDDELTGGDGPDTITGNSGADVLRGRAGNDILDGRRGGPDVVSCGRGRGDMTLGPNRRDFTARDCEAASFRFGAGGGKSIVLDPHPNRREPGSVTFSLRCPRSEELDGLSIAMSGSIGLRGGAGRQLGRGTIPEGPGRRCGNDVGTPLRILVPVELNRRGRRLLSRHGGARVRVSLGGRNLPEVRWMIQLSL
jgi:Ca2+-binding RTX toxin-like protein